VTVSITVDVDGVAGLACRPGGPWQARLTARSEHAYVWRGLERVLAVLADHDALATFYVPGATAAENPAALREVLDAGHEIAHHGFAHLPTPALTFDGEREELVRGLVALQDQLGVTARGYRSPGWELTPATLELLPELGFAWDSSLMADERPYRLGELVELPVHWRLDDVPYWLAYRDPREVLAIWTAEYDAADGGHITFTIHPEHTGRGHRLTLLDGLLDHIGPTVKHSDACAALI